MVWKRDSDTIAFDPRALRVIDHPQADDRTLDECWGFFSRMMGQLAQYPRDDFLVEFPTALTLALGNRARVDLLWDQLQFAGLGEVVQLEGGRRAFRVLNDADLVHVKTASEIAFEKDRKSDNSDPSLTLRVRLRDGDACRYCGMPVWFTQRKGDKRGTYDHRPPGQPGSAETSVVACGACNSGRGGLSKGLVGERRYTEALEAADARYPLLPVPAEPLYNDDTRAWLNKHAAALARYGLTPPPMPATPVAAADEQAPGAAAAPAGARRATGDADGAPRQVGRSRQKPSLPDPDVRDGTGLEGEGRAGPGRNGSERSGRKRHRPRGRRGRGQGGAS